MPLLIFFNGRTYLPAECENIINSIIIEKMMMATADFVNGDLLITF